MLRRELQEKRDAEAAKKAAKAKKKIVALEKAIKLAEGNKASPLEQFKTEKFSAWGDDGAYTMKHVLEICLPCTISFLRITTRILPTLFKKN